MIGLDEIKPIHPLSRYENGWTILIAHVILSTNFFSVAPVGSSATAGARWDEEDIAMTTQQPGQNGVPIEDAYSPSAVSPVHLEYELSR